MATSKATTVAAYLKELPPERRAVLRAMRSFVRRNLPSGYRETMNWGLICYEIPLSRYPNTYNGQPLCYGGLAAQKNYNALYLTLQDPIHARRLKDAFRKAGKKLDMGKGCLRFHALDDLVLDVIGEIIAATPPDAFIARYEAGRGLRSTREKKGGRGRRAAKA